LDGNKDTVPAGFAHAVIGILVVLIICSFVFAGWGVLRFINRPTGAVLALGKSIEAAAEEEIEEADKKEEAADTPERETVFTVNGEPVDFGEYQPLTIDEQIFVPINGVFEALGYEVDWDDLTNTAVFSGRASISITVGENSFVADGDVYELDTPAQIINGAAMFPLMPLVRSVGYGASQSRDEVSVISRTSPPPDSPELEEPEPPPAATPRPRPAPSPAPVPVSVWCTPCTATGMIACTSCNGIGGGRGTPNVAGIPYEISPVSDVWWCTACGGSGTLTCRPCGGSGWVTQ
jgi:pyruvate/2-oxoglutarate dehydrogenase complex dihydrolipoamide acyltransferase (E2) component